MVNNLINSPLKQLWYLGRMLFWLGLWCFGLGILCWYLLRWEPGDRLLPVRLGNYFMPWLLLGLIPALMIAGLARRKWLIIVLAIPSLMIGFTFAPLFLPRSSAALAASSTFKVMSYNIWGRNWNIKAAIELVNREQPDILLLQELRPSVARLLTDKLANLYGPGELHFVYESTIYQGVISRYPITPIDTPVRQGRVQKVRVETPNGPIMVWNIHSHQPRPWLRQYRQTSALVKDIAAADGPLIVGGDFNTTDQSDTYKLVTQHLDNAHWEAGWGFGFSFPAPPRAAHSKRLPMVTPVVRIDHIFYNHHFFARKAGTLRDSGGSDHLPVIAEFSFVK